MKKTTSQQARKALQCEKVVAEERWVHLSAHFHQAKNWEIVKGRAGKQKQKEDPEPAEMVGAERVYSVAPAFLSPDPLVQRLMSTKMAFEPTDVKKQHPQKSP